MLSFLRRLFQSGETKSPKPDVALDPTEVCDDCGATEGKLHDLFCTRERCPFCGGQLAGCDCIKKVLGLTTEEARSVDEYVDDSVEPLQSIMERWRSALERRGRVPFHGSKLQATADDLILMAARGEVEAVRRLLARGVAPDAENEVQHTALMSAARNGQLDVVRLLLDRGANAWHRNAEGFTPLHCAVGAPPYDGEKQAKIVSLLLENGADPNSVCQSGGTPLMNAAWFGCNTSIPVLLKAGADRSHRDNKGRTAEDMAVERGRTNIVEILRTG